MVREAEKRRGRVLRKMNQQQLSPKMTNLVVALVVSSVASGGAGGGQLPPHFSVPPGLSVHSRFLSVHSASLKILKN